LFAVNSARKVLVAGHRLANHGGEGQIARLLDQTRRCGIGLGGQRRFSGVDGLGGGLQFLQAEGDGLVEHRRNHVVA
jgi:hypothetical protein